VNKDYKVGQVLYIGMNKNNKIIPVQIVERLVRETMDGDVITYMVVSPKEAVNKNTKQRKLLDLSKIKGQIFVDLNEARRMMSEKARMASEKFLKDANREIKRMVEHAAKISSQVFNQDNTADDLDDDEIDIGMEMPNFGDDDLPSKNKSLKNISDDEEENGDDDNSVYTTIPVEDGKKKKAKIKSITMKGS